MTKKKQIQAKPQKGKIRASTATAVNPDPTREKRDLSQLQTPWVPFFKDSNNLYINDLALRYRRSSTLAAIINSKVNYSVGEDFQFTRDGEVVEFDDLDSKFKAFLEESNPDMQSFREIFKETMFNWILAGNLYSECHQSGDVKGMFAQDCTKVRVNRARTMAIISSFWRDIKDNRSFNKKNYPVEEVELWNKKIDTKQRKFIVHEKRSVPEYDFYGLPDYIGSLKDADIEYEVDKYNLADIQSGFAASSLVSIFGDVPDGETADSYATKVREKLKKPGEILVQLLDNPEQAAKISEFKRASEGQFIKLEESAYNGIVRGHRWFPALAGIETSGKLGGNQELINQWRIVMNNVVIPDYQEPVLRHFNKVLKIFGFDYKIGLVNVPPVGLEHKINPTDVLEKNELREELGREPKDDLEGQFVERKTSVKEEENGG